MRLFIRQGWGRALLVAVAVVVGGAEAAWAQTWKVGENVTAILKGGTLTISGRGDITMKNHIRKDMDEDGNEYTYISAPWIKLTVKNVVIGNGVTSIGENAFLGCAGLTSVTIPNSVTSIGARAFAGCEGLMSVDVPDGVASIGGWAFHDCSGLKSVTFPNSLITLESGAFAGCTGLTSVTIPNSVSTLERGAFAGCTGLTSVTIGNGVKSLDGFDFTANLTAVVIGNNVAFIGERTFAGCTRLTSITIPNSVYTIGEHAFDGCTGLTSVTIPDGMEYIRDYAFAGCTGLMSVTIPNSVKDIGWRTFSGCTNLTYIIAQKQMPSQTSLHKHGLDMAKICLIVPPGSVDAYRSVSGWKAFTCIKEMDNKVTEQVEQAIREAEQAAAQKKHEEEQRAEQRRKEAEKNASYFTDKRDGKKYKAVVIGGKKWMAENLNNGTGGRKNYGRLYDWKKARTACPIGWRLPSLQDWKDLATAVGGEGADGKILKSKSGWPANGTDDYGFSALPGGFESDYDGGSIGGVGETGCWWAATGEKGNEMGAYRLLCIGPDDKILEADIYEYNGAYGASVRCVQN